MKILYITTAFPRNPKDPITPWLVKTITLLNEKDIKIDVFTSSYKGLTFNRIKNINVYRFRYFIRSFERLTHEEMALERLRKGGIYKILPLFYIIFGSLGIIKHCKKIKYDIIHVHWPFPHFIFGYIASRIYKIPLVCTFHGVGIRFIKQSSINLNFFLNWIINKSALITVNSTHTAGELSQFNPKNISVIPFGAAVEPEEVSEEKNHDVTRLLFVGRLVERKGVEYLLQAVKFLKEKTKIKLIIVGDGNLREALIKKKNQLKLSDKEVQFIGKIPGEKLTEYYKNCDIFILPAIIDSRGDTEGLGVVLLEAMSFKKPVVASKVGGIVDIVKDKKTGLLVKEKSAEELASAIEFLINNPEERKKLAQNGYLFQKKNFSWESITSSLISIYQELTHY
jgi:glycosyltransferase involved in cell wall biosynthesis